MKSIIPQRHAPMGEPLEFLHDAINKAKKNWSGCIIWPYGKTGSGYGAVVFQGRQWAAHRLALSILTDVWDTHLFAIHEPVICHEPACINTNHLRWGTQSDNELDKHLDGTTPSGVGHGNAKLTLEQVEAIREDGRVHRMIAVEFGVDRSTISYIKRGETWQP